MMVNVLKLPEAKTDEKIYDDIIVNDWYYDSTIRAKSAGLLNELAVNRDLNQNSQYYAKKWHISLLKYQNIAK